MRVMKVVACCFLWMLISGTAFGQEINPPDDLIEPIYVGNRICPIQTQWSVDSKFVFFCTDDYETERNIYYQYFPATGELSQVRRSPFTEDVKVEEFGDGPAEQLSYLSPNHEYSVYESNYHACAPDACWNLLGVSSPLTTSGNRLIWVTPQTWFYVRWNTYSSAFLIIDYGVYGGLGLLRYVGALAGSGTISPVNLMNFGIGTEAFYDLSPDGRRVLLPVWQSSQPPNLVLWDASIPSMADSQEQFAATDGAVLIENERISGASFIPNDDQNILIVNEDGILQFNIQTGEEIVLRSDINSTWAYWVYFSPDNQYAAILSNPAEANGWPCQMHVVALNDYHPFAPMTERGTCSF